MTGYTGATPVIVGSGRSGTTWVQDALAEANGYATAFEPLHPEAEPAMAAYAGRYLRAEEDCAELKLFLQQVFSGQVRNRWITYRVRPDRLAFRMHLLSDPRAAYEWWSRWKKLSRHYLRYRRDRGKPILAKFIRANLMLPWLTRQLNVRIAAIVRHPGAVVESKLRLGGDDWEPGAVIERYRSQANLNKDLLRGYEEKMIDERLTPAGEQALIWCIENKLLMEHAAEWGIVIGYYEDLLDASNEVAWRSLVNGLGLKNIPDAVLRRRASQQASQASTERGYDSDNCGVWQSRLSNQQLDEIQLVLDTFEIDQYSMNNLFPSRRVA